MSVILGEDRTSATRDLTFEAKNTRGVLGAGVQNTLVLRPTSNDSLFIAQSTTPIGVGFGYIEVNVNNLPADHSRLQLIVGFTSELAHETEPGKDVSSCAFHAHEAVMHSKNNAYPATARHCLPLTNASVIGVGINSPPFGRRRMYYISVNGRVVYSAPLLLDDPSGRPPYLVVGARGIGLDVSINMKGPFKYSGDREGRAGHINAHGQHVDSDEEEVASVRVPVAAPAVLEEMRSRTTAGAAPAASVMEGTRAYISNVRRSVLRDIRRLVSPQAAVVSSTGAGAVAQRAPPLPSPATTQRVIATTAKTATVSTKDDMLAAAEAAALEKEKTAKEMALELSLIRQERDQFIRRLQDAEDRIKSMNVEEFEVYRRKVLLYEGVERSVAAESDAGLEAAAVTLSRSLALIEEERARRDRCVVCMDAKKSVLYLPCKHFCTCKVCSNSVAACPLCRAPITTKVQL